MARDTGIDTFDVGELAVVGLSFILISAHGLRAVQADGGGEVVNVAEAQFFACCILIS